MSGTVGDISVDTLLVISTRGKLDLAKSFVGASVYESIFTPGTICDIIVIDSLDYIKELNIQGDETVYFKFKVPGGAIASFTFHLNAIEDIQSLGAQKAKMYKLQCISKEIMYSKREEIQKAYNGLHSDIIKDIHNNFLKSEKPLIVENTATPQNILIPSYTPFKAISMIKKRAVSRENKSSLYTYFETRENEEQTYKFVTFEKLYSANTIKTFKQSDAINADPYNILPDDNIISFSIPNQLSSIEKIRYGGPRKITQLNFTTQEQKSNIIDTVNTDSKISKNFISEFFDGVRNPPQSYIPVDISQRAVTKIPETAHNIQAYLSILMQNSMRIRVPGDTSLAPGFTIECILPSRTSLTGQVSNDSEMSGKFLITRIHHRIATLIERPRYTCSIECVKINYQRIEE